jgi:transposase
MKQQTKSSNITVGLDLGDRRHRFCVLDERGEVVEQDSICNDRVSLRKLAGRYHGALGVMEAGAHSPWISRFLEALGWRVVVSNPRKVRAIYQHERKSDQRDALMLARIGRMDLALLYLDGKFGSKHGPNRIESAWKPDPNRHPTLLTKQ